MNEKLIAKLSIILVKNFIVVQTLIIACLVLSSLFFVALKGADSVALCQLLHIVVVGWR